MLKPDKFSCSQKIWLKQDPPVQAKYRTTSYCTQCNFQGRMMTYEDSVDKYSLYYLVVVQSETYRCIVTLRIQNKCDNFQSSPKLLHILVADPRLALYHSTPSLITFLQCKITHTCQMECYMTHYFHNHCKNKEKKEIYHNT